MNLLKLRFKRCRVCYAKDQHRKFDSILSGNREIQKILLQKYHISYHQYFYRQDKVLICSECSRRVKSTNSEQEVQELGKIIHNLNSNFLLAEKNVFGTPYDDESLKNPDDWNKVRLSFQIALPIDLKTYKAPIITNGTKQKPSSIFNDNDKTRKPKSRKNSFICQKCGKVLLSPQAFKYHVKNLHILKEISNETIWVSNKIKEGRHGSEWHCCECSKIYSSPQALRPHLKLHYTGKPLTRKPKSRENSFICQKCGKVLLSPQALRYHVENLHILKEISNETIWASNKIKEGRHGSEWYCCECSKIYSSPQALRPHLKLHYTKIFKDENDNFTLLMNSTLGN